MPVKLLFIKSLGHLPVAEWHSVERIGAMPNRVKKCLLSESQCCVLKMQAYIASNYMLFLLIHVVGNKYFNEKY